MMGTVGDGGGVKTRRQMPRVPDKGDVLRVEDTLLSQLEIKTPAIVRSANVFVPDNAPASCEDPPKDHEDH